MSEIILTEKQMECLADEDDVHVTKYVFIENLLIGFDEESECNKRQVVFKDTDTNKLYMFQYFSNSRYGIDKYDDGRVVEVELKQIKTSQYIPIKDAHNE